MKHDSLKPRPVPESLRGKVLEPGRGMEVPLPKDEPVDLGCCFRSGQTFRWREIGGVWYGAFAGSAIRLSHGAGTLTVEVAGAPVAAADVYRFLGLDVPLPDLQRRLASDRAVRTAVTGLAGLRVLRQDPWECFASFLCSQWNNIPRIEGITSRLASRWGTTHRLRGAGGEVEVAVFPTPEALAAVSLTELAECGLGYRCRYLLASARMVAEGAVDLHSLRARPYAEALATLLTMPGIGRKVADCILLFSMDKWEACPVDVWVRRALHRYYGRQIAALLPDATERYRKGLSNLEYRALVQVAWQRWGRLSGWAQQYLFCALREEPART